MIEMQAFWCGWASGTIGATIGSIFYMLVLA